MFKNNPTFLAHLPSGLLAYLSTDLKPLSVHRLCTVTGPLLAERPEREFTLFPLSNGRESFAHWMSGPPSGGANVGHFIRISLLPSCSQAGELTSQLMMVLVTAVGTQLTLCAKPNSDLHLNFERKVLLLLILQIQTLKLREVK